VYVFERYDSLHHCLSKAAAATYMVDDVDLVLKGSKYADTSSSSEGSGWGRTDGARICVDFTTNYTRNILVYISRRLSSKEVKAGTPPQTITLLRSLSRILDQVQT
jgi:hypothetical protein